MINIDGWPLHIRYSYFAGLISCRSYAARGPGEDFSAFESTGYAHLAQTFSVTKGIFFGFVLPVPASFSLHRLAQYVPRYGWWTKYGAYLWRHAK